MRLTIISPDNVFEHEVDPSMEVRDVKALIEAEVRTKSRDGGLLIGCCADPVTGIVDRRWHVAWG